MSTKRSWQCWLGILLVLVSVMPVQAMSPVDFARQTTEITDQSLQPGGALVGEAIRYDGQPVTDLSVRLHSATGQIAETRTDTAGRFEFRVARGGVFAIEAAGVTQYRRLWAYRTAPPAADQGPLQILVGTESSVVRGQGGQPTDGGWLTPYRGSFIMLGVLAGVIVGVSSDSDDAS